MRIAVFDYAVTLTNPAGSCHRLLIERLCDQHEFTVFAPRFDNPRPDRVRWIPVYSILRPLAALFLSFHLSALVKYFRFRQRGRFSLVQSIESNFGCSDVVYAHFCHRWFLDHHWKSCKPSGIRGLMRWVDHVLHAALEPAIFRRAKWIVAASASLAREIEQQYPFVASKLRTIPNAADADAYQVDPSFDRAAFRAQIGLEENQFLVVFVALGQFERKGLPLLIDAIAGLEDKGLKLFVVGGTKDLVGTYKREIEQRGLARRIQFTGIQADVRPYLWAADLMALPSHYEVFPLVVLQAAAAAIPLLVTPRGGGDQLGGAGCILVEPRVEDVRRGLEDFVKLNAAERSALSRAGRLSAEMFRDDRFVDRWSELYSEIAVAQAEGGARG
jgi:glycosyltransferase involved in cell wall biosynthesis